MAFDYVNEGTVGHMLYRNMPDSMIPYMIQELSSSSTCDDSSSDNDSDDSSMPCREGYEVLHTPTSTVMKAISHTLDIIAHPGIVYLLYIIHRQHLSSTRGETTLRDVLTWPVIVVAWHLSRLWSIVHSYHNNGVVAFWYYGFHVYKLNTLDSYLVSYIAEGVCFIAAIVCRLYWDQPRRSTEVSQ